MKRIIFLAAAFAVLFSACAQSEKTPENVQSVTSAQESSQSEYENNGPGFWFKNCWRGGM